MFRLPKSDKPKSMRGGRQKGSRCSNVDDMVLRRNMKNVGRKGGKLESQWIGPYS